MHKLGPRGPKHFIFGDHIYSKNVRRSGSMYSSTLMLENIIYHYFTRSGPNSQDPPLEPNSQFLVNSVHFR